MNQDNSEQVKVTDIDGQIDAQYGLRSGNYSLQP